MVADPVEFREVVEHEQGRWLGAAAGRASEWPGAQWSRVLIVCLQQAKGHGAAMAARATRQEREAAAAAGKLAGRIGGEFDHDGTQLERDPTRRSLPCLRDS